MYCEPAIIMYCFVVFMSVFLTDALAFICGIEPPDIAIEKAVTRTRLFLSLLFPMYLSSFGLCYKFLNCTHFYVKLYIEHLYQFTGCPQKSLYLL